ncbi:MAG TPA: ribonuclease H-like domain-containing protein [Candidatus Paceibacterota bacterium]|nr:ribonuclease H-like domain-containing protein [Candidatus Paceibacterota bacterium]
MLDKLVIDIETSNTIAEVGGKQNLHLLDISMIGVYSYNRNEFLGFNKNEFPLFEKLLKETGAFIGFSLHYFDIPVLKGHFEHNFSKLKVIDILEEVENQRGHKIGLDALAQANIGAGKTGSGLEAIQLYHEGKIEELKNYCLNDVKITKDLYELAKNQGSLIIPSHYATPVKISISWPDLDDYLEALEKIQKQTPEQVSLF